MKVDKYSIKAESNYTVFEFVSEGPKGSIRKLIQFQKTNEHNLYNLAFGDKNIETGQLDDLVISNNGDSEKVLATVISALYAFLTTNQKHLFMQQEAPMQELDFIGWVLQNFMEKYLKISTFMVKKGMIFMNLKLEKNTKVF